MSTPSHSAGSDFGATNCHRFFISRSAVIRTTLDMVIARQQKGFVNAALHQKPRPRPDSDLIDCDADRGRKIGTCARILRFLRVHGPSEVCYELVTRNYCMRNAPGRHQRWGGTVDRRIWSRTGAKRNQVGGHGATGRTVCQHAFQARARKCCAAQRSCPSASTAAPSIAPGMARLHVLCRWRPDRHRGIDEFAYCLDFASVTIPRLAVNGGD